MTAAPSFSTDAGIILRPGEPADVPFLAKTWLTSMGYDSRFAEEAGDSFWTGYRSTIAALLQRSGVLVAAAEASPETIIGFAVTEARGDALYLHFVYVSKGFRRNGIAGRMLGPLTARNVVYTARTKLLSKRVQCDDGGYRFVFRLPRMWTYDPFPALRISP